MDDVVVIGPGAIGGAAAGALVESGHAFRIAARTRFDTLEVRYPGGSVSSSANCVAGPAQLGIARVVLLAVKAHQTAAAAPWLAACVGPETTVFILQNGVEHIERVRPFVPERARLVPVVVAMPASREAPGKIVVASPGRLAVQDGPGSEMLGERLDCSFLEARVAKDWPTTVWGKLMLNAAGGAIGTLARRDNRMFATDAEAKELVLALMREVAAVARAEGADLSDGHVEGVLEGLIQRAGPHKSSIVVDRIEGRATEWDARNAVVGRFADKHGVAVPLNRLLTTLIRLGEPAADLQDE